MKPECSATQSSTMTLPYKRAIADMLSGKIIFSTVDLSYNELLRRHGVLFDKTGSKLGPKNKKVKVFQLCIFFLYYVWFLADPNRLSL